MRLTLIFCCAQALLSCNATDDAEPIAQNIEVYFNYPGTTRGADFNLMPAEVLVERMDAATESIDACIYGFSKEIIYEALIRAWQRGVKVRVVGDGRHFNFGDVGYRRIVQNRIPMQVGNFYSIMHNKFFVIDNAYVFAGTGNITTTGFTYNNNHWVWMPSAEIAQDFRDEFDQMFEGRFSNQKEVIDNGNIYQVGDTTVEIYFSPQEDSMGIILNELEKVDTSIHFQIFAFTKDQVGSLFIEKHRQFLAEMSEEERSRPVFERPKKVVGILDKSQLHGNGQYHEGYRLIASQIPMRLDANENSRIPGDYQAGGGRLHTKTMILDAGTPNARVLTGSFNWSSAATVSNDEFLIVLRGERVVQQVMDMWEALWIQSKDISDGICVYNQVPHPTCASDVQPGDVIISEVHWDGWNGEVDPLDQTGDLDQRDQIANDEFVELYNTTNKSIDLSLWTIGNGYDFAVGFAPGTVIQPGQYFLVVDHNLPPFSELDPQRGTHAFINPDFVLNTANDQRFLRMNLKNTSLWLELRDVKGRLHDTVGDRGPAFFGGRQGEKNYSMERVIPDSGPIPDGTVRSSWRQCQREVGGENVAPRFREKIVATPGAPNSIN